MSGIKEKGLIVKSNDLVQASYSLTLQEARIILLMASRIQRDDREFKRYQIKVKEFAEFIGISKNKNIYNQLLDITKRLRRRSLLIKNKNSILETGWLSSSEYFVNKGYVELEFSEKLKPYLLQLKERFTKIQLENVIKLKRSYSIRLYELLKQWQKLKVKKIELLELKRILGIEDKYAVYANLKNKILKPSQEEINSKTDIAFTYTEIKKGRKVVMLSFEIYENRNPKHPSLPSPPKTEKIQNPELYQKLIDYFCIYPGDALEICTQYSESRIQANLKYVEQQYKRGSIKKIGPYTLKAIKDDYRLQKSLFDEEFERTTKEKQRQAQQEDEKWHLEIAYQRYREGKIDEYRSTLSTKKLENLKKRVITAFNKNNPSRSGRKRIGENLFLRLEVEAEIADRAGIPSFEEWVKQIKSKRGLE